METDICKYCKAEINQYTEDGSWFKASTYIGSAVCPSIDSPFGEHRPAWDIRCVNCGKRVYLHLGTGRWADINTASIFCPGAKNDTTKTIYHVTVKSETIDKNAFPKDPPTLTWKHGLEEDSYSKAAANFMADIRKRIEEETLKNSVTTIEILAVDTDGNVVLKIKLFDKIIFEVRAKPGSLIKIPTVKQPYPNLEYIFNYTTNKESSESLKGIWDFATKKEKTKKVKRTVCGECDDWPCRCVELYGFYPKGSDGIPEDSTCYLCGKQGSLIPFDNQLFHTHCLQKWIGVKK